MTWPLHSELTVTIRNRLSVLHNELLGEKGQLTRRGCMRVPKFRTREGRELPRGSGVSRDSFGASTRGFDICKL